ncbi:MAG: VWA domain-containing protein [Isosphaeraceae bacterium]
MASIDRAAGAVRDWLDRSPLADPKSVGGSALFHAVLLVIASAAALTVAAPVVTEGPRALQADLEPVDNRAESRPGEGGGSPGALGGDRMAAALEAVTPPSGGSANLRPAPADALLSEILPSGASSEAVSQALPGPDTSASLGLLPGPGTGTGGGGGSGGGVGGGIGRGIGPGTEFFGAKENARSFAYVIDCSGSMATRNSLDVAKRELLNSLGQLPPDAQFAVVFYNLNATVFSDPTGRRGMMSATAANKARVDTQLNQIAPDGGTDHMLALRSALALRPEVIFFLTDADLMTQTDVNALLTEAAGSRIQAVEFGRGFELGSNSNPLRRLANGTGGTYRYIDVMRFPR